MGSTAGRGRRTAGSGAEVRRRSEGCGEWRPREGRRAGQGARGRARGGREPAPSVPARRWTLTWACAARPGSRRSSTPGTQFVSSVSRRAARSSSPWRNGRKARSRGGWAGSRCTFSGPAGSRRAPPGARSARGGGQGGAARFLDVQEDDHVVALHVEVQRALQLAHREVVLLLVVRVGRGEEIRVVGRRACRSCRPQARPAYW